MGMNLAHGGHLTHGSPVNFSGQLYHFVAYGVDRETGLIDFNDVEAIAKREKPKMITVGASAYSRNIDYKAFREIADSVGAFLFADIAHPAGLIAARLLNDPLPHCHAVTSTTHKTLRGPRGGLILMGQDFDNPFGYVAPKSGRVKKMSELLDSMVIPGIQGGPLMHVIAGKAVAFKEALEPGFEAYGTQVIRNAQPLAARLQSVRLQHRLRRDRQPPDAGRSAEQGADGQGRPGGAGRGGHHREQERRSLRRQEPADHERHPDRHARPHDARDEGNGDGSGWRLHQRDPAGAASDAVASPSPPKWRSSAAVPTVPRAFPVLENPPDRMAKDPETAEMSFLDHLEELRWRIVKAMIGIVLGMILCWIFIDPLMNEFLLGPIVEINKNLAPGQQPITLQNLKPFGQLFLYMEVAIVGGIILSLPNLLYQFWAFIAPGLLPKERQYIRWIVFFSSFCFLAGVCVRLLRHAPVGAARSSPASARRRSRTTLPSAST